VREKLTPGEQQLVVDHAGFTERFTQKLTRTMPPWADRDALLGAAYEGLVHAARTYNPGRGTTFTTWAAWRIRGAVRDELRARRDTRRARAAAVDAAAP